MATHNIKDFYDLMAVKVAEEWYGNTVLMPTLKDFLSFLPESPRILDLGCGTGHESKRLHDLGATVIGVDFSHESIRIAKERNPDCTFVEIDFFDINESFGLFDGIFAAGSLIHIPMKKINDLLKILKREMHMNSIFEMIFRKGSGRYVSTVEFEGILFKRIIYLHNSKELIKSMGKYGCLHIREGILDKSLKEQGWVCHIFKYLGN